MTLIQTNIFEVHRFENNPESQINLDKRRSDFSDKCKTVFDWLIEGMEITVLWAANNSVSSLPRRIMDLRKNGVLISDRWDEKIKVWYMDKEQKEFNKKFQS